MVSPLFMYLCNKCHPEACKYRNFHYNDFNDYCKETNKSDMPTVIYDLWCLHLRM